MMFEICSLLNNQGPRLIIRELNHTSEGVFCLLPFMEAGKSSESGDHPQRGGLGWTCVTWTWTFRAPDLVGTSPCWVMLGASTGPTGYSACTPEALMQGEVLTHIALTGPWSYWPQSVRPPSCGPGLCTHATGRWGLCGRWGRPWTS